MDVSKDGSRLLSVGTNNLIYIWDVRSRSLLGEPLKGHDPRFENRINRAEFSPDSNYILSSGDDGTIRLWGNLPPGNILQVACRYLPHINGRPDTSTEGLAAEIGIEGLTLPDDCDTYDPPLPPEWRQ